MRVSRPRAQSNKPVKLANKAERALAFRSLQDAKQGLLRMLERSKPVQPRKGDR